MGKGTGLWGKIKKTMNKKDANDDERIAAYLAKQDLCVTIREIVRGDLPPWDLARGLCSSLKGSYAVKAGSECASDLKNAMMRSGNDTMERVIDKVS